jgi:hypothetical protein
VKKYTRPVCEGNSRIGRGSGEPEAARRVGTSSKG